MQVYKAIYTRLASFNLECPSGHRKEKIGQLEAPPPKAQKIVALGVVISDQERIYGTGGMENLGVTDKVKLVHSGEMYRLI